MGYYSLKLESNNFKRGGVKKGFLKSESRLNETSVSELKSAFKNLYTSDNDTFVLLNKGVDFKESSATQVEMQLNQSKQANTVEFAKLFHISPDVIAGKSTDTKALAKLAAIPLMKIIESALNKTMLLEKEKETFYFAFDTKELLKGEMNERFLAYKTALDANFMQIDEVRYAEDLDPLGLTWIKLGLKDVLYDPKTKTVYTPNTNKTSSMEESEINLNGEELTEEERAKKYIQKMSGKMNGSKGNGCVWLNKAEYTMVQHEMATNHPDLPAGFVGKFPIRNHMYKIVVADFGSYGIMSKKKLK